MVEGMRLGGYGRKLLELDCLEADGLDWVSDASIIRIDRRVFA